LYAMASLFIVNFSLGIVLIIGFSCLLLSYGLFYERLIKIRWMTYGLLGLAAFFLAVSLFIGLYGINDNVTFDEDAVIVLGAGIRGEQVSLLLSYRLDKAVEYCHINPKAIIVVSGGQGPQEDITEALAMERYLISRGMPKERIIREEESTSTHENFSFSKNILDDIFTDPYTTVVITNSFHIYRATRLAEKLGLNATHYHGKTSWYSIPVNYARECIATLKFWLFGE